MNRPATEMNLNKVLCRSNITLLSGDLASNIVKFTSKLLKYHISSCQFKRYKWLLATVVLGALLCEK